jgi:hypothetical protein
MIEHAPDVIPSRTDRPSPPPPDGDHLAAGLGRIAWMITVLACLIGAAVLGVRGDYGYAGVTLAVALAAAINLF